MAAQCQPLAYSSWAPSLGSVQRTNGTHRLHVGRYTTVNVREADVQPLESIQRLATGRIGIRAIPSFVTIPDSIEEKMPLRNKPVVIIGESHGGQQTRDWSDTVWERLPASLTRQRSLLFSAIQSWNRFST